MYPNDIFLGIDLYDVFIFLALIAALLVADRMAIRAGFSIGLQRHLIISAVAAIVLGFGGAIVFQGCYHSLDVFYDTMAKGESFATSIKAAFDDFSLTEGMTFYGGLLVGAGVYLIFWFFVSRCFKLHKEVWAKTAVTANIAAIVLPLAHGIGRFGCLFAGCCHGKLTDAWFGTVQHGVTVNGTYYQEATVVPIQLFEALFLLAVFALTLYLYLRFTKPEKGGRNFPILPVYMIVYGIWRFFIEYARADERGQSIIPFLSPSQLTAVLLIAGGILYFGLWIAYLKLRKNKTEQAVEVIEEKVVEEDGENEGD